MRGLTRSPLRLLALLAAVLVLGVLALDRLAPTPGGPAGSSYATAPAGAAAYAELLRRDGRTVTRVREPLADAGLDRDATLVVLAPEAVPGAEARAIRRHLDAGGRLVAGGGPTGWLGSIVEDPPAWRYGEPGPARPRAPLAGVRSVAFKGGGYWARTGGGEVLLATAAGPTAVRHGEAIMLSDPTPLLNLALAEADDAAFGLAAAGPGRPVAFLETVHGYESGGLAALPARAKWVLAGLAVAALLLVWSLGRRLGPPEPEPPALAPPRRAYAEALAALLEADADPDDLRSRRR